MRLTFVRHGQSLNNALWDATGMRTVRVEDPELTEIGLAQSQLVAEYLAQRDEPFTHLYTSLMVRAVQTGHVVAERLNLPLLAWVDLHEVGGMYLQDPQSGAFLPRSGKGRSELQARFPRLVLPDALTDDGWWNRPFEDHPERPVRAQRVWDELRRRHTGDDHVLIITHGGFYNHLLATMLALPHPPDSGIWFALNNVGVTQVWVNERTEIRVANLTCFLPPRLLT